MTKASELFGIGCFLHAAKLLWYRKKRQPGADAVPFRNFLETKDANFIKI
jgi:hypothetical protein